jgi:hypothetical protein
VDWHPYHGDRHTQLAFIGIDVDAMSLVSHTFDIVGTCPDRR